jgi:hypothetical protein
MTSEDPLGLIGVVAHFVRDGLTYIEDPDVPMSGRISQRGKSFQITRAMIVGTADRAGSSWLELLDDPDGQVARWGHVFFARGVAPEAMALHPWARGSAEEAQERARRIEEAYRLPSHVAVNAELAKINREFPRTSAPMSSVQYKYRDNVA